MGEAWKGRLVSLSKENRFLPWHAHIHATTIFLHCLSTDYLLSGSHFQIFGVAVTPLHLPTFLTMTASIQPPSSLLWPPH